MGPKAFIERGGGIRPGDNVVVLGAIGIVVCGILKRQGGACVILSEADEAAVEIGLRMGATQVINPLKENFAERVLEISEGYRAKLYLLALG